MCFGWWRAGHNLETTWCDSDSGDTQFTECLGQKTLHSPQSLSTGMAVTHSLTLLPLLYGPDVDCPGMETRQACACASLPKKHNED